MRRSLLILLLIAALAAAVFASCRSGGEDETTSTPSSDDDDNDDNDTTDDDTTDDDDDNDTTDDDTTDDDDDTSPGGTLLAGEIRCFNTTETLADRPVKLFLYAQWIPNGTLPTATTSYTVPATGLPFTFEWDLAAVAAGDYYVFAFLDAVDGDGIINYDADPVAAPYDVTTITSGETTKYNVNLVAPGK